MKKFIFKVKKRALFVTFWFCLIVSFIFSAFLIVLKANGYQLNYKNFKILKTGMITLNGYNTGETIIFNGKDLKRGLPIKLSNLEPKTYEIVIEAKGYQNWQKNIKVDDGVVSSYQNIVLFFSEAKDYPVDSSATIDLLTKDALKSTRDIQIVGNEIFYQNNLVSRFSQPVLRASLYPDGSHIIFQVENEVRSVELDGGNNTLLFKLSSNDPTIFSFENNGAVIIFKDGDQIKAKVVR